MGITAYREYFDFNQTGSDPMKIERINENQIRCTLSNFDLSVRNMNLGELSSRRSSSFKRPTAFSRPAPRRELEQHSSAKYSVVWAGVIFSGFIS